MSTTRKVGLVLATVATAMWALILLAVVTTDPDEGVNIGAALMALLALPLSIAALVTLLVSRRAAA